MKEINLLIGGEAGQGLVTIGLLLSKVLVRNGYEILVTQSYHSRIRGGHNTFAIRMGTEKLSAPLDAVDILVALNAETIDLHLNQLTENGIVLADAKISPDGAQILKVPFDDLGSKKMLNTVAFGILGRMLGLSSNKLYEALEAMLGKKHPETLDENKTALEKSYFWASDNVSRNLFTLPPIESDSPRLLLNGNEAIALGALAAGLKFCAFYPMTPSTSIVLNVIAHADAMGCVVEQAEDEIAAINMAIGASFAGAPSMVSTSGGGFALMTEGISLAGMTETPVLVVVAQRPGPATGLPTRTEQGDLEFVLHAGHGEFPRAVFAPGSVEACYHLSRNALHMAERYQSPVFLLTDQFLADSLRGVAPFDPHTMNPVESGVDPGSVEQNSYKRYVVTENGISPRLLPGTTPHLVVADSDEHTEEGHITENHGVRISMVEKRLRKMDGIRSEVIPPVFNGKEKPDLLLISWGSSQGPVQEAAVLLQQEGRKKVATLHFDQVWPLIADQFVDILKSAREVVSVEANATGQFARLIKRETGFAIPRLVSRYDGLPFTANYIVERLTAT